MKTILVYGDSLPWGLVPGSTTFERYSFDIRWPGKLQLLLGEEYRIIEENLCARTLDSNDERIGFEGRNGMEYIIPCLDSHDPVDLVVLTLGLNEIKSIFDWTPEDVAEKMRTMVRVVKQRKPNFHNITQKILLLSPPFVREGTGYWGDLWVGAQKKSRMLCPLFKELAKKEEIEFTDLAKWVKTGVDGVHLDEGAHGVIAEKMAKRLKRISF